MKAAILVIGILLVLVIITIIARKNMHKGDSKLSVYEHPSAFKKPDIEMVSTSSEHTKPDRSFQMKSDQPEKKVRGDNLPTDEYLNQQ